MQAGKSNEKTTDTAMLLFETATLRSGFTLNDQIGFAERVEQVRPPKSSKICLVCDHSIPVSTSY